MHGVVLGDLMEKRLYLRPTEWKVTCDYEYREKYRQLWDVLSDAPMSTEFANARFLVPRLAKNGLAMFVDCDVMFRCNPMDVFKLVDPSKAVTCVKHVHVPDRMTKMDGQMQTRYARKNWSSVMIFNCDHPANKRLTPELINTAPGRDLHRFCWLEDDDIGELPAAYNYLVGITNLPEGEEPKIVHWTEGAPCMPGYEHAEFAQEFWKELRQWAH
jgi:lipopolysaccharide biosynthesis glycosyltransferase